MRKVNWLKLAVHIGALTPIALIIWDYRQGQLSVNPIQELTLLTGWYALVLLILSLACTPLNTFLGWRWVLPLRKLWGLYAFLYAALHFFIFAGFDYGFDLALIWQTIIEKRYIVAGLAAFLILIPLAITSTKGWMRRLGKNWKHLHRWVYLASLLVIVHFVWLVKSDIRRPLAYGAVVALLLVLRLPWIRRMGGKLRSRLRLASQPAAING
ncbi:MAG: sulfoxide reductase heme-binding subunit YedZ, partial [Anaerolineae bacterium]|nr:sulfoxide reductase heme-binding subunit YedZ [Anaerolineae bacterium]